MRTLLCLVLTASTSGLFAQVLPPNESGVSMGHYHLTVRDLDVQKKFWTEVMGASLAKWNTQDVIKMPGTIIMLRRGEPKTGTKGTAINHIGFKMPDVAKFVQQAKAKGGKIVTAEEAPASKADYWLNPAVNTVQAYIMGPDDVKIELSEEKGLSAPIANHHIHWNTADADAIRAWYIKMFGATPSTRGTFQTADVPGVNLTFSKSDATIPTRGSSLDHIGFEVKNLEAFCKKLEAAGVKFDRPFQFMQQLNLSLAFFTDPWGTYIELTEGLDKI
jgi:catechol 2,3-dioxygenase-like lactoylglutathione lyase family enzyme